MKALEKDPARRYGSASEFAADIQRHLADEPVLASPPSATYRMRKFVRKHRTAVSLVVLIVSIFVAALLATTRLAYVARVERANAEERSAEVRRLALTLLNDVDNELQKVPAGTTLRIRLFQTGLNALNSLSIPPRERKFSPFDELFMLFSSRASPTNAELPVGWNAGGVNPAAFDAGIDGKEKHGGRRSGYLFAREAKLNEWGTLGQTIRADDFRGKRVHLSAFLRSESVHGGAGLWMSVYGLSRTLSADAMENRLIKGTTAWKRYDIVLEVPDESTGISFGLMLYGGSAAVAHGSMTFSWRS
jgi:hypothetical protein